MPFVNVGSGLVSVPVKPGTVFDSGVLLRTRSMRLYYGSKGSSIGIMNISKLEKW